MTHRTVRFAPGILVTMSSVQPPGFAFDETSPFLADCPARAAVDLLGQTWNAVVVFALRNGPMQPSALQTQVGGISQKMLTQTLRRLEAAGLVRRRRYRAAPPRVEYELTEPGRDLLEPIYALGRWAHRHADRIAATYADDQTGSAPGHEAIRRADDTGPA